MRLGIIGGTGASELLAGATTLALAPGPWGAPSGPIGALAVGGHEVLLLARHGSTGAQAIAPHAVNYRANVWAFRELGVDHLLGINTVGGISAWAESGALILPHQLIDYTWGRAHTYVGAEGLPLRHVEFTEPFCPRLRALLVGAAVRAGLDLRSGGTYGVTQGPRLESAAEIDRLERDGCDVVGMTAMPEAALAREAGLSYAICCVVVNRAAGRGAPGIAIHGEIEAQLRTGMTNVQRLLGNLLGNE